MFLFLFCFVFCNMVEERKEKRTTKKEYHMGQFSPAVNKALGPWADNVSLSLNSALLSLPTVWCVDTVLWLCPSLLMKHYNCSHCCPSYSLVALGLFPILPPLSPPCLPPPPHCPPPPAISVLVSIYLELTRHNKNNNSPTGYQGWGKQTQHLDQTTLV